MRAPALHRRRAFIAQLAPRLLARHRRFYEALLRQLASAEAPVVPSRLFVHAAGLAVDAVEDDACLGATSIVRFFAP